MKPPRSYPRIRKTIKWGGAALTVVLVAVWIGSGWYFALVLGTSHGLQLGSGQIVVFSPTSEFAIGPGEWHAGVNEYPWSWWYAYRTKPGMWSVEIPLWFPVGVCMVVTTLAFRLDTLARRRANMNLCPKCHYDRTGLAAGAKCPECGVSPHGT